MDGSVGIDIPGFSFTGNIDGVKYYLSDTVKGTKTYSVR